MKITQIEVNAGRGFNHPFEQYANFRCDVRLTADLAEGEDADRAVMQLQAKAESLAEDHKTNLLNNVRSLAEMASAKREMVNLEEQLKAMQERLAALRTQNPGVTALPDIGDGSEG